MRSFWNYFWRRSPATTYQRLLAVHMHFARGRSAMEE